MIDGRFISANGLEIFYRDVGQGRSLILLHGATDTHKLWQSSVPFFADSFRVLTPDSRGHGHTINPSNRLSYRDMADDLAEFIHGLKLEKPFVFGYSDGGQAALEFGMHYPDIPSGLVIGGAWYQFSVAYQEALRKAGFIGPGKIDFQIFEKFAPDDWKDRMQKFHPHPDPDYPKVLLNNLASLFWTPLNYDQKDFNKIQVPTLVMIGEKDEMVPLEEARELASLIPGAEFAIIPGATHNQVIVAGGEFLNIVMDFLLRQID